MRVKINTLVPNNAKVALRKMGYGFPSEVTSLFRRHGGETTAPIMPCSFVTKYRNTIRNRVTL